MILFVTPNVIHVCGAVRCVCLPACLSLIMDTFPLSRVYHSEVGEVWIFKITALGNMRGDILKVAGAISVGDLGYRT